MKGQREARIWVLAAAVVALLISSGCVISPRITNGGGTPTPTPTPGIGGELYVASGNSILRFSNAEAANGSITPAATITSSRLQSPQRMLVDTRNDRLFVANSGSILIYDNASTKNGTAPPDRVISGNNTGLSNPTDLALDTGSDQLYVADGFLISVFANASTMNGNPSPARSFNMGVGIGAILLDTSHDQLFVADPADDVVDILGQASAQNVFGQATSLIAGPDTHLAGPAGLALDGNNRLIVSNSVAPVSITVYPKAATANLDVIPVAVLSAGNTKLTAPKQIVLDQNTNNGELYVVDSASGSILVFSNMSTANANQAPARVITSTTLPANSINGIALDTTR
ncbi:MAG TPA: hypothetical protein VJN64_16745 [Terriglobales bacterium]|nr:hypothetical protein [Terriglobales bacterium]